MLVIRWSRLSSSICISGYVITIKDGDKKTSKTERRFVDSNVDRIAITTLHQCRQYTITMQAYLGRFQGSKDPIYVGTTSEPLVSYTTPDTSLGPFELSTLQIRRGKTSITAFWKRSEWPCLFPAAIDDGVHVEQKLRIDICPGRNGSTCFKPQGKIVDVDERLSVTFQGLYPCTDYHVSLTRKSTFVALQTMASYFQHKVFLMCFIWLSLFISLNVTFHSVSVANFLP